MPKPSLIERVHGTAKVLGLDTLLDRKPRALSGGQRQRVAMGRAIVRQPKVYLMDEPLSNLDAKLRVAMRGELMRLHQRYATTEKNILFLPPFEVPDVTGETADTGVTELTAMWTASVDPRMAVAPGDRVSLTLDLAAAYFFDAETGLAIDGRPASAAEPATATPAEPEPAHAAV